MPAEGISHNFIERLEEAVRRREAHEKGEEVRFLCPAHDDHSPSASWNRSKHVWYCHACGAGGGANDLAKRLHVELPSDNPAGLSLDQLAGYVGLPMEFLRSVGVDEGIAGVQRTKCIDVPYLNERGEVMAVRKRLRITGEPRMVWRRGDKTGPYGLSRLTTARDAGLLIVVEGESDSWAGWYAGLAVLGLPGASAWQESWKRYVQDVPLIYVWREPDRGGDTLVAKITADLPDVRIIEPPGGLKDLNGLWHAVGHDRDLFLSRVDGLLAAARPATQLRAEAFSAEGREILERCRHLLEDPLLLDHIKRAMTAGGYAGDLTGPLLAYLSLTSRFLPRPLNLAFVAPSGAGKNAAVDAAIALMPEDAYFLEKAGSARALVYADTSFQHKIVIVSEADSIPQEDGSAASAVRSLAEDSYMTYDVVVKDNEGNLVTRRVTKEGPTGLITTSTKPLGEQLSTRTFAVPISDTPEQTRQVMRAHAARVSRPVSKADVSLLIDLQRWLALAGDHDVVVPYAEYLADLVPSTHVRMRRDFRQLLTIIQAVALLHQRQRARDKDGQIIATLDDYRIARELVLGVFTAAASGGVTPLVRRTVEALQGIYSETKTPATRKAVGDRLGLANDTVWHRIQRGIELGYIVNLETRERQPAKLVPGDPLPDDLPALPTAEELDAYMCGSVPENDSNVQTHTAGEADHTEIDAVQTKPTVAFERLNEEPAGPHTQAEMGIDRTSHEETTSDTAPATQSLERERHLRGEALVALDKRGYPKLTLNQGQRVGPGLEAWAPVLRTMNGDELQALLVLVMEAAR